MTVTLSKEATEFVEAQMRTGAFATPSDVIDFAVELDKARRMLAQRDNEEIKALLLEAIDSPCTPWRGAEEIEEIMAEIRNRAAVGVR